MSDESFGFLMSQQEKDAYLQHGVSCLPDKISWLKNKIVILEECLAKKPSKIKEIRDLERQVREAEYNLLGVKPNRMSKEGVWYCSWLHPEQEEPVGIIVANGILGDVEYIPYFHGVKIYRDYQYHCTPYAYPYWEAKKLLMSARKSANVWTSNGMYEIPT